LSTDVCIDFLTPDQRESPLKPLLFPWT